MKELVDEFNPTTINRRSMKVYLDGLGNDVVQIIRIAVYQLDFRVIIEESKNV